MQQIPFRVIFSGRIARAALALPLCAVVSVSVAHAQCGAGTPSPVKQTWTQDKFVSNGAKFDIFTGPVDYGHQLQITSGLGGALWVALSADNAILKLQTNGHASIYSTPAQNSDPEAIVSTPKLVWVAEFQTPCVASITAGGKIKEYATGLSEILSTGMALGRSSTPWFATDESGIGFIPSNHKPKLCNVENSGQQPTAITLGRDGDIWFIENTGGNVGHVTPGCVVKTCAVDPGSQTLSYGIASGSDGRIWFAVADPKNSFIGSVSSSCGDLRKYTKGLTAAPQSITAGPDGNLYFGETGPTVGRITTKGVITEYPLKATEGSFPVISLTTGPDKNIWFTNNSHSQVGKLTLAK